MWNYGSSLLQLYLTNALCYTWPPIMAFAPGCFRALSVPSLWTTFPWTIPSLQRCSFFFIILVNRPSCAVSTHFDPLINLFLSSFVFLFLFFISCGCLSSLWSSVVFHISSRAIGKKKSLCPFSFLPAILHLLLSTLSKSLMWQSVQSLLPHQWVTVLAEVTASCDWASRDAV